MDCKRIALMLILGITFFGLSGCIADYSYEQREIDIFIFGELGGTGSDFVTQLTTLRGVTVSPEKVNNEQRRRQMIKEHCTPDDTAFEDGSMKRNERYVFNVEDESCDVTYVHGFRSTAMAFASFDELTRGDTISIKKTPNRIEVHYEPARSKEITKTKLTLWLSSDFQGRVVNANASHFNRKVRIIRAGPYKQIPPQHDLSIPWRKVVWEKGEIQEKGFKLTLGNLLQLNDDKMEPGLENSPTFFPDR